MRLGLILIIFIGSCQMGGAQHNIDSLCIMGICTPEGFALPSINGLPRPKGFQVFQERVPSSVIVSTYGDNDSTFSSVIRRTKSWSAKLNVPVINRDQFKLIAGLKYFQQEFAFQETAELSNTFHNSLRDKHIRSGGLSLYAIKSFIGNKYLAARGTFRLNGDFTKGSIAEHQKSSFSVIYAVRHRKSITWGAGISYSNTFGRSSIYPVFFYKNKFNEKWALEALLPISTRLIFQPNEKNVFYFQNQLEGDNYNLNFDGLTSNSLYLEKADFKSFLTYEREVYDFFWVSFSGGARFNINFDVSDSDAYFSRNFPVGNTKDLAISNSLTNALFFRFGIFLVPPKAWSL